MEGNEVVCDWRCLEDRVVFGLDHAVNHSNFSFVSWNGNDKRLEYTAVVIANSDNGFIGWIDVDEGFSLVQLDGLW